MTPCKALFIVAAAAAFLVPGAPAALASYDGPWCAVINVGRGISEKCYMRSFEMCRQEIQGQSSAFCRQNQYWAAAAAEHPRRKVRRKHYYR
jgi:hypothetical protein